MSDDIKADISLTLDDSGDGRWLGYDELSALRRIDRPSAIKLATRKKWLRRKNNAGLMQVLVPMDWLTWAERRRDRYGDGPPAEADVSTALSSVREAFDIALKAKDAEISALRGQVDAHMALLSTARLQAQDAQTQAQEAKAAMTRAELAGETAAERARQVETEASELRVRLEAAEAAVASAEHDKASAALVAEELAKKQAAERKARGRWARVRAAWRGE